ncbi:MAG: AAA family ATPase [Bacteroidetes bacterium]|nr:AAA family ATPase [Bacteroidota bacterium]
MNYLELLNEPQRGAVMQTEGPVMIIAGAGSGKTRVLTYRIAYLIQKGIDPFNILSLTFTNKAAREMRKRIESVVGSDARALWMGTFHSIFAKILRIEAEKLGYPSNFTIYDSDDSKSLIKTILKELNLDDKVYKPGLVLSRISSAKNNLITAAQYSSIADLTEADTSSGKPKIHELYRMYTERCFRAGAMDFDDLLVKTHELLTKFPEVLNRYQHKFQYVMVDEFQDTNTCQYAIIKKLAAMRENICVVGDDAQSIYAFRGATIRNILNFEKDYPDLKVFKLEQNYRSTSNIVDAAGSIIRNNKEQLKKKVWTSNPEGEKIRVIRTATDNEEGKIVAESIFEDKLRNQQKNEDYAILYRTNAQSRSIEEALRKMNIPYRIYGGMSFYQRKEIKDMVSYLRLVVNPGDEEALKRVINYPARGIGKTTIDKLILAASQNECSIWVVLENIEKIPAFGSAIKRLVDFRNMMLSFRSMLESHNAYDLAMHIARQSAMLKTLHDDKTVEGISRYENLVELMNGIKEFVEDDTREEAKTLGIYLQDIALLTDSDSEKEEEDVVRLMTIHASKGLEFPNVFIVGMEENLFPSQMSLSSRQDLEEERRLFYVASTRAEKKLTLSYAMSRFRFGNLTYAEPSRFIQEIDPRFLNIEQIKSKKPEFNGVNGGPKKKESISFSPVGKSNTPSLLFNKKETASSRPVNPNFTADDTSGLKTGMQVEHQRFGIGKVVLVEGNGDGRKATVEFEEVGVKQLILKYAKIRILS